MKNLSVQLVVDQIVRSVYLILLSNQKTYRKCKDSFEIVSSRATKYVLS